MPHTPTSSPEKSGTHNAIKSNAEHTHSGVDRIMKSRTSTAKEWIDTIGGTIDATFDVVGTVGKQSSRILDTTARNASEILGNTGSAIHNIAYGALDFFNGLRGVDRRNDHHGRRS